MTGPTPPLSTRSSSTTLTSASAQGKSVKSGSEPPLVKPRFWRVRWNLLFLLPLTVAVILIATTSRCLGLAYSFDKWGCDATGKLYFAPAKPSIWSLDTALYPTIPLFTSRLYIVRTVDIIWDLFIGRGYHCLCAIVIYQVFRTVMADITRNELLPLEQVLAMEYSTISIPSLLTYVKGSFQALQTYCNRPKASRCWKMSVLILAAVYTLAVPTWLSAMTGYQNVLLPLLPTEHGFVSFEQIHVCMFVIVDGHRIGLEDNTCVRIGSPLAGLVTAYLDNTTVEACYPGGSVYSHRQDCDQPSVFFLPDERLVTLPSPVLKIVGEVYSYQNHTLSSADLAKLGRCEPQQDQYEWGFSCIMLFSFTVATAVVAVCVSLTWYKYADRVWPQQVDMMFGKIRTVLVVAASVENSVGAGMYEMTEKELNASLTRPGPYEERRPKFEYVLPVGSDGYHAYLRRGLDNIDEKEPINR